MSECLGRYCEEQRDVNGRLFTFLVECLNENYTNLCTADEVADILRAVPRDDLEGLDLLVFRQPKDGEEQRSCCWVAYSPEFLYNGRHRPALMLDAVDDTGRQVSIRPADRENEQEVECLREEGHRVADVGVRYIVTGTGEAIRKTQLYRTVFHLVYHHIEFYRGITAELDRERLANQYARRIKKKWISDLLYYD
jgi:hypothetical protein